MEQPSRKTNTNYRKTVMVSSTALDLPQHRKEVMDACLRQGMFPIMMEHLPASDIDAVTESLRMVNEADIYLGIFAYRHGYVPKGSSISLTEIEYNHAVERGIPRLIFLIDKTQPIHIDDVELGEGSIKLEAFKERLVTEQVVNFFNSPTDLRAHIVNSLSHFRQPDLASFHYVNYIPIPPEPYIAHHYTLLQTRDLIGRQAQLKLLTDWVSNPSADIYSAHVLSIISIGGMGKSALIWKWFNDIAPYKMQPIAGRIWWSFYESDATFENFVIRSLAYVTNRPKEEFQELPPPEREAQLLDILDRTPFLLVFDGLERILLAYSRMDAAHMADEDPEQKARSILRRQEASNVMFFGVSPYRKNRTRKQNKIIEPDWLPKSSEADPRRQRKASDLRTGAFLRRLSTIQATRVLVSSRLQPADLQTDSGEERPGCKSFFLYGLSDDDAVNLWRTFGVNGSREKLIPLFHTFDNHPLLIQVLAGVVAFDHRAPGDFDRWRRANPKFSPFSLPLVQVKSHVLEFAFNGLNKTGKKVLHTIAAFRMPATYDTLAAVLVGRNKPFSSESDLVTTLTDLENRGLLGWDRRANRYDLHPLVRGIVWGELSDSVKKNIYQTLNIHFKQLSISEERQKINKLEDLTATIELYNTLIGLGRYDDALTLFDARLSEVMLYYLDACRERAELLEMLFPNGIDHLPRVSTPEKQANVLNGMAVSLTHRPIESAALFQRCIEIHEKESNQEKIRMGLCNLSNVLRFAGALYSSEVAARKALLIARRLNDQRQESICLSWLGLTLAVRGEYQESEQALRYSLQLARSFRAYESHDYMVMLHLWLNQFEDAQNWANSATEYSERLKFRRGIIRATRLQGAVASNLGDPSAAEKYLQDALKQARTVNLVEEELPALIGLAALQRQQSKFKAARELQDDIQELAEHGPFPLFHSDAFNTLAQLEIETGNQSAAVKAAIAAYHLSWCDGPPFAYHYGLQAARINLAALGIPEPALLPFDPARFESMPHVEIILTKEQQ